MKHHFALALVLLIVGCSAQGDNDGGETDNPFKLANIMNIIKKLSNFQELVLQHNDTLVLQELRNGVHQAMQEGVQCFQKELANANGAISKLVTDFRDTLTGGADAGTPGTETSTDNVGQRMQRFVQFVVKFMQSLNNPEIQKEIKGIRGNLVQAYRAGKECFTTSAKEGLPQDKYELLKELWNQVMGTR